MLTKLRIPQEEVALALAWGVTQTQFLITVMALILVLGLVLESISIILHHARDPNLKHGPAKAKSILAHKFAVAIYYMLKNGQAFDEQRFVS